MSKRCTVAWATPAQQYLWEVELPEEATVDDALRAAQLQANMPQLPWERAPVGIFGSPCARSVRPRDGDRIEIYRPLPSDPRARRRAQVQRERQGRLR